MARRVNSDWRRKQPDPGGGRVGRSEIRDRMPARPKPSDRKRSDRKPSDRKPSDRKPSDPKPSDPKPSDRKPSDRKPGAVAQTVRRRMIMGRNENPPAG